MRIAQDNPLTADYYRDGVHFQLEYFDVDSFDFLEVEKVQQVYGVCFDKSQMVIVRNGVRGTWGLVGGQREEGESIDTALIREIEEESNMQVLSWKPVGVQKVTDQQGTVFYQLRTVCVVKPFGPFTHDPGGVVSEIKHIKPQEYIQYFDWGEIGDHIITRAMRLHISMAKE